MQVRENTTPETRLWFRRSLAMSTRNTRLYRRRFNALKVSCEGCGGFHDISPTGMAVVIQAFQQGDLQRIGQDGVTPLCLGGAFTPETLKAWRSRMSAKTVVAFDQKRWSQQEEKAA